MPIARRRGDAGPSVDHRRRTAHRPAGRQRHAPAARARAPPVRATATAQQRPAIAAAP
ncbi:hypothetical protein [Adlercreutzia equolifaciens]|uniref:hypothetical protein n=1 Tax=Adlercreutzia equolifaciens TaxID=446660 RepID=UPI001CC4D6CD|nr:hypothetical protein [Adlercreutzia equolifaciens]